MPHGRLTDKQSQERVKIRHSKAGLRILIPLGLIVVFCGVPTIVAGVTALLGSISHSTDTSYTEFRFMNFGDGQIAWKYMHRALLTPCDPKAPTSPNVQVEEIEYFAFLGFLGENSPWPDINISNTAQNPLVYTSYGCPPWNYSPVSVGVSPSEAEEYGD